MTHHTSYKVLSEWETKYKRNKRKRANHTPLFLFKWFPPNPQVILTQTVKLLDWIVGQRTLRNICYAHICLWVAYKVSATCLSFS